MNPCFKQTTVRHINKISHCSASDEKTPYYTSIVNSKESSYHDYTRHLSVGRTIDRIYVRSCNR